jgi:hypothetical protein
MSRTCVAPLACPCGWGAETVASRQGQSLLIRLLLGPAVSDLQAHPLEVILNAKPAPLNIRSMLTVKTDLRFEQIELQSTVLYFCDMGFRPKAP